MHCERYRRAGLDAICRSHVDNPPVPQYHIAEGFVFAHRGAGMIACCRLVEEGLVEASAAPAIAGMIEREWAGNAEFAALFAPYPEEPRERDPLPRLVAAFSHGTGVETGDPHSSIFPAAALREFAAQPALATPKRVAGLLEMAPKEDTGPRLAAPPDERIDVAALCNEALREFAHALTAYPTYDNSYCGHILTWALAVLDLHDCGQEELARLGARSWRHYLTRCHQPTGNPFERHGKPRTPPPAREAWPALASFWQERPAGNLESSWAHLPKYALAILSLSRRASDAEAVARARSLYHLMVY